MDLGFGVFLLGVLLAGAAFEAGTAHSTYDDAELENDAVERIHYGSLDTEATKSLFEGFIRDYKKVYSHAEKEKRLRIFAENLKRYDAMNADDRGTAVYGITKFSDLTSEEFERIWLMRNVKDLKVNENVAYDRAQILNLDIPKNFDWREKGAVSPVRSQGGCGSCWAFTTVAVFESQHFIKHKKMINFSEQQLVDCATAKGCDGGYFEDSIKYINIYGGLQTSETYPYVGKNETCKFEPSKKVDIKIKEFMNLPQDESVMAAHLFKNGPFWVTVNASAMQGYVRGIAHPSDVWCDWVYPSGVDHAITLVGYGEKLARTKTGTKNLPFWIFKNSWGNTWGLNGKNDTGYWYAYRGDNVCGILRVNPKSVVLE